MWLMETIILEILRLLKTDTPVDDKLLAKVIRRSNRGISSNGQHHAKRQLLPYYLGVKAQDPAKWAGWSIDAATEARLLQVLQMKPRRTASGVATISVITKPWKCASDCLYCPRDLRMPKSYLSDEPACQRAEQNFFDPYLQVKARLHALTEMGHATDKVELIVLGGTWSDYTQAYQLWFTCELFRALNEGCDSVSAALSEKPALVDMPLEHMKPPFASKRPVSAPPSTSGQPTFTPVSTQPATAVCASIRGQGVDERRRFYREHGISSCGGALSAYVGLWQQAVEDGTLSYNRAVEELYGEGTAWEDVAAFQAASLDELEELQRANETAQHRVVGLVFETRPDAVSCESLTLLRRLGCTKVQMGIQSLDPAILRANKRGISVERLREAFELVRVFGFKIHAHFMLNLLGATPEGDKRDYERFVSDEAFQPDEVKLYPCALVKSARLTVSFAAGTWRPYSEDELLDVLAADLLVTPPFVRVSRMIRDISSKDILVGNKKTNLRQLVEAKIAGGCRPADILELGWVGDAGNGRIREIRSREISTDAAALDSLRLDVVPYATTMSKEFFLQWVTPDDRIAGFLRLSLPLASYVEAHARELRLHQTGEGAQHLGLGRQLVERACSIAAEHGYAAINVISSVGTREYYRSLGFCDATLYQSKRLS